MKRVTIYQGILCKLVFMMSFSLMMSVSPGVCGASETSDMSVVVNRTQKDELTPDRLFDIVFLTTRSVYHTLETVTSAKRGESDRARAEFSKAFSIMEVLQKQLPEITVDMTIRDGKGGEIKDRQVVRINDIPLFQWMTGVKVVVPVMQYRNKGFRNTGKDASDFISPAQMWVDVDYLFQNLKSAAPLINEASQSKAVAFLDDALMTGIRVEASPYDDDLKPVIHALLQAYWQAESGEYERAGKRLADARRYLTRYAQKAEAADDPDIKQIISDLSAMETSVKTIHGDKIKDCWFKIVRKKCPGL